MNKTKRLIGILLIFALLCSVVSVGIITAFSEEKQKPLDLAVITDIHYFAAEDMGGKNEAWRAYEAVSGRQFEQTPALLEAALTRIEKDGCEYLLVPGDLTRDGEYNAHRELAAILEEFQTRSGIPVFVINGNHDINNEGVLTFASGEQDTVPGEFRISIEGALTFANGKREQGRATSPEEFCEIYQNLGYDKADSFYQPPKGEQGGMLSYAADLKGGAYRLIALDAGKYSADTNPNGMDGYNTGGNITQGLMDWALAECAKAQKKGQVILGMMHHNFVPHTGVEAQLFQDFVVDDWMWAAETLADAGMHFGFTGHLHANDISSHVSDNGETFTDIMAPSLTEFPNQFREVSFRHADGALTARVDSLDPDIDHPIVVDGKALSTKEIPYKYAFSFEKTYGESKPTDYLLATFGDMIWGGLNGINEQGGLLRMLQNSGLDIEELLVGAIGEGLTLGPVELFTVQKNLMSFLRDLCGQVDRLYIQDTEHTFALLRGTLETLFSLPLSDLPCTYFLDSVGYGDPDKPGTLGDLLFSTLLHAWIGAYPDDEPDVFLLDAFACLRERDGGARLFEHVRKVLVEDLLEGEILASLELRPETLFPSGSAGQGFGILLKGIVNILLLGDNSYGNLLRSVMRLLPEPYNSLDNLLGLFLDEYLVPSQLESIGWNFADTFERFALDDTPDDRVTITYNGPVDVEVRRENYRLPTNIVLTFGETETERNILWFTKYSVTGTDIELLPYSEKPKFTGKPTKSNVASATAEPVRRGYPGLDLGIFGGLGYSFDMTRHEIKLSSLEPGKKYSYRVGDAKRDWWSEPGVIEVPQADTAFTFFHMTDQQGQSPAQYEVWAEVVDRAFKLFPEGRFILSTGDQVDSGTNFKQWQWFFNSASKDLLKTVLMPVAGNHENNGGVFSENFLLPNAPKQDGESGLYYSFDYNNAHFIVLNTNDLSDTDTLGETQLAWLKKDAAASNAQWKVVALHKAPYSNGSHVSDTDVTALREQLGALLPELGIDLVLQGHDHVYLRTDILADNQIVPAEESNVQYDGRDYTMQSDPHGTVYVISACAGVKFYPVKDAAVTDPLFPRATQSVDVELPVLSAITIDGARLYLDAFTVDGDTAARIDGFALEKTKTNIAGAQAANPAGAAYSDPENPEIPNTGAELTLWVIPLSVLSGLVALLRHAKPDYAAFL